MEMFGFFLTRSSSVRTRLDYQELHRCITAASMAFFLNLPSSGREYWHRIFSTVQIYCLDLGANTDIVSVVIYV